MWAITATLKNPTNTMNEGEMKETWRRSDRSVEKGAGHPVSVL